MAKEKSLNTMVARFYYKGNYYEIDYLTDADRGRNHTYHLYGGQGPYAVMLHEFEARRFDKEHLIKLAKEAIESYQIRF